MRQLQQRVNVVPFRGALLCAGVQLLALDVAAQPQAPAQAPPPPPKVQSLDDDAGDTGDGKPAPPDTGPIPPAIQPTPARRPPRPHGKRHEHDGVMLRVQFGPSFGSATLRSDPAMQVTAAGLSFSTDLGFGFDPLLTLHLRYGLAHLFMGQAKLGGEVVGADEEPGATASMLGLGATYFLMPANLFATLAVGLGAAAIEVDQFRTTDTEMGWAFNLDLGKEWWLGDNTAMGVLLRGWFSAMSAESGANVFMPVASVLLTASYQ